jgi:Family of unknown function (DUF5723)
MRKWTKLGLFFVSLFYCNSYLAQTSAYLLMYQDSLFENRHSYLEISAQGGLGSDLLNNAFIDKMVFGGHLDDELLDGIVGDANEQNRAGLDAKFSMQWWDLRSGLFGNPCIQLMVGISSENHGYVGFSKDFFSLIYRGNATWAGQTKEIGPLHAGYQSFQKFSVGVVDQNTYSQYRLSFVSGQDYTSIDIRDAALYTSSDLDSLVLTYEGKMYSADPNKRGIGSGKGLGLSLDFDWNIPMKDKKGWFGVSAYNLGMIRWNGHTENYTLDSTFVWTGFEINDLFGIDEDLNMPELADTIGYTMKTQSRWVSLPADIRVRMLRKLDNVLFIDAGISLQPYQLSLPELRLAFGQDIKGKWQFTEQILFGGYGGFRAGIGIRSAAIKNFIFQVGSENLLGWLGKDFRGRDLSVAVSRIF